MTTIRIFSRTAIERHGSVLHHTCTLGVSPRSAIVCLTQMFLHLKTAAGWRGSLAVQHLSSRYKALGSIPGTRKHKTKQNTIRLVKLLSSWGQALQVQEMWGPYKVQVPVRSESMVLEETWGSYKGFCSRQSQQHVCPHGPNPSSQLPHRACP